jgi:hypothetical protein
MKKSLLTILVSASLVLTGATVSMAAPVKDKAACSAAKVAHKAAVTKADKKATAKAVATACKAKHKK